MKQLTWYRGSILPYSSLWSVLRRATWLNDLRPGDLLRLAQVDDSSALQEALKNGGDANVVELVAELLQEDLSSFSSICLRNQIPHWLFYGLASGLPRWCPECMRLGYHTWLMSLNLVVNCPIHQVPLITECNFCRDKWKMDLRGLAVRHVGCRCGQKWMRQADPQSMRHPVLDPVGICAWSDVEQWINITRRMCVNEDISVPEPGIQLALTERWCADLGIKYPSCFAKAEYFWNLSKSASREWTTYRACTTVNRQSSRESAVSKPDNLPQLSVYRTLSRRLRRKHRRSLDKIIVDCSRNLDPFQISLKLKEDKLIRIAFLEMIWTRLIEEHSYLWRWPRREIHERDRPYAQVFMGIHIPSKHSRIYSSLSHHMEEWLVYHHSFLIYILAWNDAIRQIKKSIDDNWADWIVDAGLDWRIKRIAWYAYEKNGHISFVGYRNDAGIPFFSDLYDLPEKALNTQQRSLPNGKVLELSNYRMESGFVLQKRLGDYLSSFISEDYFDYQGVRVRCVVFSGLSSCAATTADGVIRAWGWNRERALESIQEVVSYFCKMYGRANNSQSICAYGFEKNYIATMNVLLR